MSLSGNIPEGGSKTLGKSLQIAYQWDGSAVGTDIEYRMKYNILYYFIQASFGICIG